MSCCNTMVMVQAHAVFVTIPQAVWAVATSGSQKILLFRMFVCYNTASGMSCCNTIKDLGDEKIWRYNTASGMSCCNLFFSQFVILKNLSLQYRKRYELLQRSWTRWTKRGYITSSYNTASGMSCCNLKKNYTQNTMVTIVTIPQAVWAVATI